MYNSQYSASTKNYNIQTSREMVPVTRSKNLSMETDSEMTETIETSRQRLQAAVIQYMLKDLKENTYTEERCTAYIKDPNRTFRDEKI